MTKLFSRSAPRNEDELEELDEMGMHEIDVEKKDEDGDGPDVGDVIAEEDEVDDLRALDRLEKEVRKDELGLSNPELEEEEI